MDVKTENVTKVGLAPYLRDIKVSSKNRSQITDIDAMTLALKKAEESGLKSPAVEPARGGISLDEKTGVFSKVYRFTDA